MKLFGFGSDFETKFIESQITMKMLSDHNFCKNENQEQIVKLKTL